MRTPPITKEKILEQLPIGEYYEQRVKSIRWNGDGQGMGLCCFHEDHQPSLSVNLMTGYFQCFGCGAKGDVFKFHQDHHGCDFKQALHELADLAGLHDDKDKRIAAIYDYTDQGGHLVFQVVRYKPKDFKQRRRDDNGKWVWNLQGITRVPYNLPEVVKADLVVIPEGEKDVETLRSVGVVGSCNPGGAGKWRPEYNQHFTGKDVVILPDNDELGREHAEQVAGYLKPVAKTVKIVKLPGLQPKGDASDWLRGGHSAFDLAFESDHTPIWTKPEKKTGEDKAVELDFNLTDAGSAECFKRLFGHDYAFVRENKKWFRFDGNRWVQDDEVVLKMLGTVRIKGKQAWEIEDPEKRKVVLKWCLSSESRIKLAAGLSIAESMLPKSITAFDTDPMSVCCENGAIDLKTGCLFQPSRQQWLSKSVNLPYRPEAECPRWIRFLDEIFNGDGDLVSFVRKAVGYSLTGLTTEQVLFFLYGTGANGKSVFLNLIGDLLGDYAETTPASTWKDNPYHDGIPNDIARMVGARLVKSIEMKEGSRLNEERVKAMTGGDRVTARFLHNEFFEFTPVCKFWVAVNHKPIIQGTDEAIWRRIRLIPFEAYFPPERRDPRLLDTLREELSGILNWAVKGALEWQAEGLKPAKKVSQFTDSYREESDLIGRFLEDKTARVETKKVKAGDLYKAYEGWCKEQGETFATGTAFGKAMQEKGFQKKKTDFVYYLDLELI